MKKIKTSELTGAALDWAVAKCEHPKTFNSHHTLRSIWSFLYSTDWSQGGRIIERELIGFRDSGGPGNWHASFDQLRLTYDGQKKRYHHQFGPTPLIAAMRCFVSSKLGDEVDVPEKLL